MYWFLIMRADLKVARGDISAVKGRRIGAAPWVEMGLRRLLIEAGIDLVRDEVTIQPVPGAIGEKANFGLMAAQALADGKIDGFWANGMGAEVAQRSGAGTLVLDIRRGDGPEGLLQLHDGIARNDRRDDRALARNRRRRGARDRRDAARLDCRRLAGNESRPRDLSGRRSRTHRRTSCAAICRTTAPRSARSSLPA